MSATDPRPFSSASIGRRELVNGATYETPSGRKLTVASHDEVVVFYRTEADGPTHRIARRIFESAIR